MLRHTCGFALAAQGAGIRLIQDYLGHRNIQHTVTYSVGRCWLVVQSSRQFLVFRREFGFQTSSFSDIEQCISHYLAWHMNSTNPREPDDAGCPVRVMRIAFLTPEYVTEPYFSGGLANYVHRTSSALAARGHDIHVFTLSHLGNDDFTADGITVHRIALGPTSRWLKRLTGERLNGSAEWLDFMFGAYRRLAVVHHGSPFHVIQVPNYSACGLVSTTLLRLPFVVRLSTYGPVLNDLIGIERNFDRIVSEWLERLQVRVARHIYAPSECVRRLAQTKGRMREVDFLPTPFMLEPVENDVSVYQQHFTGKKYLLFFGRFQLHKGFHVLVQALPQILAENPDCHAAFVGINCPSPFGSSMREYATQICKDFIEQIIFLDQTPHSQLYPIIAGAHLVVLPSLIDNLPNACLETMALGKAVVGTEGASFEEMLTDGVTGFLVPPGNVDALASKVNAVWRRDDLASIGCAARESVKRFHPNITLPLLESLFLVAIAQHR